MEKPEAKNGWMRETECCIERDRERHRQTEAERNRERYEQLTKIRPGA